MLFFKSQVQLFSKFAPDFFVIEQQISMKEFPMVLFRNVVRLKDAQPTRLHTRQSTFITPLKAHKPLNDVTILLKSTNEVRH